MVFEEKFKIGMEDVGKNNEATTKALLSFLEDIACSHSASVGEGPLSVERTGRVWVLLNWKIEIIKRPIYGDNVNVKTWSRKADRIVAYRDFEIQTLNGEVLARATSKWCLIDMNTRRPIRLTDELMGVYESEPERSVFEEDMLKNAEPDEFLYEKKYVVQRRDIDMYEHMHNLNYLDLAYEMLPDEVYKNGNFKNVIVEYRKEIKYGEDVICYYSKVDNKHVVTLKVDDKVNALIILS